MARALQSFFDLLHRGHAGGHDQRLAGTGHSLNERNIDQLERSHLMSGHVHLFEEVDCSRIKGAGKQIHSQILRHLLKSGLPLPWSVGFGIEIVESAPIPKRPASYAETTLVALDRNCVGAVSLKFHRICARLFRGSNNRFRRLKALIMICRNFRDHIHRQTFSDFMARDAQNVSHATRLLCSTKWMLSCPSITSAGKRTKPAAANSFIEASFVGLT